MAIAIPPVASLRLIILMCPLLFIRFANDEERAACQRRGAAPIARFAARSTQIMWARA
jgi:hypothetical protein